MADYTRLYPRNARMSHLRASESSSALCRVWPAWFDGWFGTGSQSERDNAARLPVCAACQKLAGDGA